MFCGGKRFAANCAALFFAVVGVVKPRVWRQVFHDSLLILLVGKS